MINVETDKALPDWVHAAISAKCKYCGADIVSNHDTGVMTEYYCSNPCCPGHMAYKMDYVAKYYDIKGFGPKTALDWIYTRFPESHLEILPEWFPENKPTETLSRIADLACIKEFGMTQAESFLDAYASFEDFFNSCDAYENDALTANRDTLLKAEKFFNVRRPMAKETIFVMATGTIHGYVNRDDFFTALNAKYGNILHVVQVGARKSNVQCLIKEEDAVDHRKSRIAKEANIPILTSIQFLKFISDYITKHSNNSAETDI